MNVTADFLARRDFYQMKAELPAGLIGSNDIL